MMPMPACGERDRLDRELLGHRDDGEADAETDGDDADRRESLRLDVLRRPALSGTRTRTRPTVERPPDVADGPTLVPTVG